jgi:hypothetical protein
MPRPSTSATATIPADGQGRDAWTTSAASGFVSEDPTSPFVASTFGVEGFAEALPPRSPFGVRTMLCRARLLQDRAAHSAVPPVRQALHRRLRSPQCRDHRGLAGDGRQAGRRPCEARRGPGLAPRAWRSPPNRARHIAASVCQGERPEPVSPGGCVIVRLSRAAPHRR